MEIEIEMSTELTDVSEILQKVTQVVNSEKEHGLALKNLKLNQKMKMMMLTNTHNSTMRLCIELQKYWSKDIKLIC
jgi:hypothetical protein